MGTILTPGLRRKPARIGAFTFLTMILHFVNHEKFVVNDNGVVRKA
jgi:hypothetical protein